MLGARRRSGSPTALPPATCIRSPVRSLAELAWPDALLIAAGDPSHLRPLRCVGGGPPWARAVGARSSPTCAHARPARPVAVRLLGWAEAKRRPSIHREKHMDSPFLQALALPPPSPASWLQGWGNSALLLHRPICTPSTESLRCAQAAGRSARGRTAAVVPPVGTLGFEVTVRDQVRLQYAMCHAGSGAVPSLRAAKGGEREQVHWS